MLGKSGYTYASQSPISTDGASILRSASSVLGDGCVVVGIVSVAGQESWELARSFQELDHDS